MDTVVTHSPSDKLTTLRQAATKPPIGEWLVHENVISNETLRDALQQQKLHGGKLGEILTHQGNVSTFAFYRTLAKQHSLPFMDTLESLPDATLFHVKHLNDYLRLGVIPCMRDRDELIVATTNPAHFTSEAAALFMGERLRLVVTSPLDIVWTLQRVFAESLTEAASESLYETFPHYALHPFRTRTPLMKRIRACVLPFILLAVVVMFPHSSINVVCVVICLFFITTLLFKLTLVWRGIHTRASIFLLSDVPLPPHSQFPPYTVLVPLFREENSVADLITSLSALDYPAHALDIKLIVEADDSDAQRAIKACAPDGRFHIMVVPPSHPQTKPKACNYALQFAKGEFITIYDAEDAPDPTQLRHAVAMFRAYPWVSCLQARLNYYNYRENWLTRLFCIEYTTLFDVILPALYHFRIPIPLGGTSNHIRASVLQHLGAWNAYNVTEDADLGVRLALEGHVTLPFTSLTQEEAPVELGAWLKQRARWIKGYIQTWGVMMRDVKKSRTRLSEAGFWGVHFFIGRRRSPISSRLSCGVVRLD